MKHTVQMLFLYLITVDASWHLAKKSEDQLFRWGHKGYLAFVSPADLVR